MSRNALKPNGSTQSAQEDWPDIMTVTQVAAYLQLSRITLYRGMEMQPPILPGRKVGGQWRFLRREIDAFIAEGRRP